jgi:hypothetical protein
MSFDTSRTTGNKASNSYSFAAGTPLPIRYLATIRRQTDSQTHRPCFHKDVDRVENDESNNSVVACIHFRWKVFTEPLPSKDSRDDRLCGPLVRVLDYRSGNPGSIPGTTREKT